MEEFIKFYNDVLNMEADQITLETLVESGFLQEVVLPDVPPLEKLCQALFPLNTAEKISIFVAYIKEFLEVLNFDDHCVLIPALLRGAKEARARLNSPSRSLALARTLAHRTLRLSCFDINLEIVVYGILLRHCFQSFVSRFDGFTSTDSALTDVINQALNVVLGVMLDVGAFPSISEFEQVHRLYRQVLIPIMKTEKLVLIASHNIDASA